MEDILTGFPNFKGQAPNSGLKQVASKGQVVSKGTAGVVISPDRKRSIYTQVLANKNINAENSIISEGYIRVETKLINGKGIYEFSIVRDSNSDSITERKIDRNDKFLVTELAFFLMARLETKKGVEVLQTYPNPVVFTNKAKTGSFTDLECMFNGRLSVKVGQTNFIEGMDTLRFRNVPQVQQSSSNANTQSGGKMGFFETTPQILLSGDQKNEIRIEAPVDSAALISNDNDNTNNYIVMMCRGFLISSK
jgi:hypothetical protein